MDMVSLTATARDTAKKAKDHRTEGLVPCVVYGNETKNMPLSCVYNEIFKAFVSAGKSTLVDLDVAGKKVPVLFHAIDFDPVSDRIIHVDFYAVDMKKEIEAKVSVRFEGEAPAVKEEGGVLVTVLDHVTVKCLPTKLPHDLAVSIESLVAFHDSLAVSDLQVPEGVVIQEDPEMMIATIQEPRKEEVIEVAPVEDEEAEALAEGEEPTAEGEVKEGEGEKPAEGAVKAEGESK